MWKPMEYKMWNPTTGFKQSLENECDWKFIGKKDPQMLETSGEMQSVNTLGIQCFIA